MKRVFNGKSISHKTKLSLLTAGILIQKTKVIATLLKFPLHSWQSIHSFISLFFLSVFWNLHSADMSLIWAKQTSFDPRNESCIYLFCHALELFFGCFIDALLLIYEFMAERTKMNMLSCCCCCCYCWCINWATSSYQPPKTPPKKIHQKMPHPDIYSQAVIGGIAQLTLAAYSRLTRLSMG